MQQEANKERNFQSTITRILMFGQNLYFWLFVLLAVLGVGVYLGGWVWNADKYQRLGIKMTGLLLMIFVGIAFILLIAGLINLIIWMVQFIGRQYRRLRP